MQKKLNCKSRVLTNLFLISSVVFTTELFAVKDNSKITDKFDKKYLTNSKSKKLFTHRFGGLNDEEIDMFMLGKSFFRIPWVEAPSATTARDGLGPLFNANTCISCHPNNGVASVYNSRGDVSRGYVSRLSIPSDGSEDHKKQLRYNGFVSEAKYGSQISVNGTRNVPFEAKPHIEYEKIKVTYPDGEEIILSKPIYGAKNQLVELNYGELHKDVAITNRIGQGLIGLGLLEMLSDEQILANEDTDDKNNDGISGKANRVYSPKHDDFRVGRYTWKASAPSIIHQVAGAANNDMSLTTSLFPNENCTDIQKECKEAPKGDALRAGSPHDLPDNRLEAIAFYLKNLKIPKSVIKEKEGEELFSNIGCASCHTSSFTLNSGYKIKPFSDMLLHDMGEGLSDGRVEFLATEQEWRTPPLWGIGKREVALGKKPDFLHDGRAKSIEEAILWHGGESKTSKKNFMNLEKSQREKVIRYIKEL
jgi:CxxC motif-containing protein (DUF1111 family)